MLLSLCDTCICCACTIRVSCVCRVQVCARPYRRWWKSPAAALWSGSPPPPPWPRHSRAPPSPALTGGERKKEREGWWRRAMRRRGEKGARCHGNKGNLLLLLCAKRNGARGESEWAERAFPSIRQSTISLPSFPFKLYLYDPHVDCNEWTTAHIKQQWSL